MYNYRVTTVFHNFINQIQNYEPKLARIDAAVTEAKDRVKAEKQMQKLGKILGSSVSHVKAQSIDTKTRNNTACVICRLDFGFFATGYRNKLP